MNQVVLSLLVTITSVLGLAGAASTQPASSRSEAPEAKEVVVLARHGKSLRGTIDGFPLLLLRRDARGARRGAWALAAKEIVAICDSTAAFLKLGSYAAKRPDATWEGGLKAVGAFEFAPRFEAELAGMLRGIQEALPNPADRTVKTLGREITLEDLKLLQTGEVFELMRCSQFSAWGVLTEDGEPIVGRNWDYPPLYSMDYACIMAVEPAEEGLSPTLDAMCFGMLGSGLATINRDGVYVAGNDAGIDEGGMHVAHPTPGSLLMRAVIESARPDNVIEEFTQAIKDRVALGLLFHFVGITGPDGPAAIVEYDPRPEVGGIHVRHAEKKLPGALLVTNHCDASGPREESIGRYRKISNAINELGRRRAKIGFSEARDIMGLVAKASPSNATLYTAVAWPAQRKLMVAVAPNLSTPATSGAMSRWSGSGCLAWRANRPADGITIVAGKRRRMRTCVCSNSTVLGFGLSSQLSC